MTKVAEWRTEYDRRNMKTLFKLFVENSNYSCATIEKGLNSSIWFAKVYNISTEYRTRGMVINNKEMKFDTLSEAYEWCELMNGVSAIKRKV